MARLWTLFIFVLCFVMIYVKAGAVSKKHTKISKKTVKTVEKTVRKVQLLLHKERVKKKKCEATVANMTRELEELHEKIDNLGEFTSGSPHIDLTEKEDDIDTSPIRVDVTSAFDNCLKSLDMNIMPEENAFIWCLRTSLWQYKPSDESDELEDDEPEILQISNSNREKRSARFIRRRLAPRDMTQPPSGFRTRREYRTLNSVERKNFHDALNVLYKDRTIACFARVHRNAIRQNGAHQGVAFLPWHRAFLALFEEALRQVDSSVFLPYWDSSMDDNMEAGPGMSVMWDDEHLGQGNGIVKSGPFAGWVTAESPLRRDIARGVGSLIRQSRIDTVMQFCRLGDFGGRWENAHNGVHRWIGGTMARSLAASDPVFYMHHAFIDYQWEKFREHQDKDCGIDPAFDYPPTSNENHAPETQMDGMSFLINKDGIADYWTTNWYNYDDTPTCASDCSHSPDLFCDFEKNLCTGEIRFEFSDTERMMEPLMAPLMAPPPIQEDVSDISLPDFECSKGKYLYSGRCPGPPPPETVDDLVERIIHHEIEMPPEIQMVEEMLEEELIKIEEYPPESEPIFFQAAPDEPNDCRTTETCVFDLVTAIVGNKRVTNRGQNKKNMGRYFHGRALGGG